MVSGGGFDADEKGNLQDKGRSATKSSPERKEVIPSARGMNRTRGTLDEEKGRRLTQRRDPEAIERMPRGEILMCRGLVTAEQLRGVGTRNEWERGQRKIAGRATQHGASGLRRSMARLGMGSGGKGTATVPRRKGESQKMMNAAGLVVIGRRAIKEPEDPVQGERRKTG